MDDGAEAPPPDVSTGGPREPAAVLEGVIARARRGDEESFDKIYRTYHPILRRHLELTSGDRADDVASATWASVIKSLGNFVGDGHDFRRWLFTIARRRLIDDLRRTSREPSIMSEPRDDDLAVDFTSPLESVEWVESALGSLPVRQAEVLSLRIVAGLDVGEIADLLDLTPENVRVLSHRAVTALRASYDRSAANFADSDPKNLRKA